ncbi:MAG: paraquat-inducible protein A [Chromatiales bacterium]|jgi:paraquat-inducible protein A
MAVNVVHRQFVNVLILVALGLLAVGVFAPLMTLEKFYFFENQVSLYLALIDLFSRQEWLLFSIILLFSIVVPLVKCLFLFLVWNNNLRSSRRRRYLRWLAHYGKWSMLDVFIVALLLVTVKLDVIANVQVHYGIYAFAASVFLTMLLTHWISHHRG